MTAKKSQAKLKLVRGGSETVSHPAKVIHLSLERRVETLFDEFALAGEINLAASKTKTPEWTQWLFRVSRSSFLAMIEQTERGPVVLIELAVARLPEVCRHEMLYELLATNWAIRNPLRFCIRTDDGLITMTLRLDLVDPSDVVLVKKTLAGLLNACDHAECTLEKHGLQLALSATNGKIRDDRTDPLA